MGRKLNISQPAVIQTELRPLDESFWIDANGGFEQWYYQNTNVFAPDRQITPLILTPHLSAVDLDTNTKYTPTFQLDSWVVKEYIDGAWVTTTITSQSQTSDYVLQGLNLIVKKNNYDATHAINITCKATYQDPRDVGVLKGVEDSIMLVTSVDATQQFPKIDIVNPATRTYNPLKDESPIYEFEGKADWEGVEAQGGTAITECKVDPLGTEEIIPTNEEMVLNSAPTLNIHYGDIEKSDQQFMCRQTANGEVSEIVGGVSAIDNIKGNTVALNQYINPLNIVSSSNEFSNLGFNNGSFSYKFTTNQTSQHGSGIGIQNFVFIAGHKYYYSSRFDAAPDNLLNYYFRGVGTNVEVNLGTNKEIKGIYSCTATQTASIAMVGLVVSGSGTPTDIKQSNYNIIDLTLMFGTGNEPSTVAAFETWLATNIGNLDYIPYTEGKLVNFGGFGVRMNQICDSTGFSTTTESGIKYTFIDKYTWNVDGTATGENTKSVMEKSLLTVGHIYYIKTDRQLANMGCNFGGAYYASLPVVAKQNNDVNFQLRHASNASYSNITFHVQVIDLTLMFGAGNEPDLDWCNKYLSKGYYPYCPSVEKNILDVMTTKEVVSGVPQYKSPEMGVKTTGFNVWDEEWEHKKGYSTGTMIDSSSNIASKNYIPCLQSSTYSITIPNSLSVYVYQYDVNKGFVKTNLCYNNDTIKTESNTCYLKFASTNDAYSGDYNHDICINISDPSRNGTYEPYWESKSDMSWITKIGIENFNIWDEEWRKGSFNNNGEFVTGDYVCSSNPIKVFPNTSYWIESGTQTGVAVIQYNQSMGLVRIDAIDSGMAFTTESNCYYVHFRTGNAYGTTYNHDICINISNAHFNGRYYPHGETAPYFPNGLCKAGDVVDEVKVENGKIKGVVRIGSYTFTGNETWGLNGQYQGLCYNSIPRKLSSSYWSNKGNLIHNKNEVGTQGAMFSGQDLNCIGFTDSASDGRLCVGKTLYDNRASLTGTTLYYELATPYEFEIDYPTKGQFMWYGVNGSGSEVPIDQLPMYSQVTQPSGYGQGTSRININALYGENIPVILRVKRYPWSDSVLPPKVTKSVAWNIPPVDVVTTSDKGSAVRATNSSENFTFSTIVNQQGEIISDAKKTENMVFDWYMVKYGTSGAIKTSLGSGLTKAVAASTLKNTTPSGGVTPSTNIYCEAFLLGAYHLVDGQYVRTKD